MKLDINVDIADTLRKFGALSGKMQRKTLVRAMRKAARPLMADMKGRAPVHSGKLRKSIRAFQLRAKGAPQTASVGVKPVDRVKIAGAGGKIKTKSTTLYYANFLNFGTADPRKPRRKKNRVLRIPFENGVVYTRSARGIKPNTFIGDAFDASADKVITAFDAEFSKEIEKSMNR